MYQCSRAAVGWGSGEKNKQIDLNPLLCSGPVFECFGVNFLSCCFKVSVQGLRPLMDLIGQFLSSSSVSCTALSTCDLVISRENKPLLLNTGHSFSKESPCATFFNLNNIHPLALEDPLPLYNLIFKECFRGEGRRSLVYESKCII